ncbi:MAG: acyltransferase family protein [Parcubacteria group bacterium]
MRYRSDIQGLRALAIIPVLLFHAHSGWLNGGYIGVDVFFVISGYLISGIVAGELDAGKFTIPGFYRRRVRRLFPALYAMLAASFVAAVALLPPEELREFAKTALSVVFFVSNVEFAHLSDYFGSSAELKPLLHTWSLAVEEQFYIVFPPLLMLMWRRWRRFVPLMLVAIGALSLASGALAVVAGYPHLAFYLAPPRAFELATGALLALGGLKPPSSQTVRDILSWIGLALIVGSATLLSRTSSFPAYGVPVCLGAALIIYSGEQGRSAAGRLLSAGPLPFIGTLSYSLYLWHWPFLVFGRYVFMGPLTGAQAAGLLAAAVLTSILCWRYIERPFLRKEFRLRRILLAGTVPMGVACAAALAIHAAEGLPGRFPPQALKLYASDQDYNHRRETCHSDDLKPIAYDDNCVYGRPGAVPTVAVWGDSHGAELVEALGERMAPLGGSVMQITASGCAPAIGLDRGARGYCLHHNRETLARLKADPTIRTVILTAHFDSYDLHDGSVFERGYATAVRELVAAGKRVVLVYPIPMMDAEPPQMLGLRAARGVDPAGYGLPKAAYDRNEARAIALLERLQAQTGAAALHPERILCDRHICHAYARGWGALYFNETHLSVTGARLVVARIPDAWLRLAPPIA